MFDAAREILLVLMKFETGAIFGHNLLANGANPDWESQVSLATHLSSYSTFDELPQANNDSFPMDICQHE
jgi:hypothetical protein